MMTEGIVLSLELHKLILHWKSQGVDPKYRLRAGQSVEAHPRLLHPQCLGNGQMCLEEPKAKLSQRPVAAERVACLLRPVLDDARMMCDHCI